jgi:DNA-directed RNA polymerase III subunit RPC6
VYQIIKQAANRGVWVKDLRFQSNMTAPRLQKVLKALEGRSLVKTVKGTASATKKIYMLFNLQPSEELTGGTWCAWRRRRSWQFF